jgi:hypothetical protein
MFDYDPGPLNVDPNSYLGPLMTINSATPTNYGPSLTAAGGGYAAASTLLASRQSAALLRANAAIAGMQAQSESQAGAQQAELYRQHLDATLGKQEAAVGGSNVTMSGSPLRSLETTAQLGAQDISQIQANAARKAWGFRTTQQGDLINAQQTEAAGVSNTIGGLITTGARAYGQWNSGD